VLLIEEDSRIRRLVREGLDASGFTVITAGDGGSAVEVLRRRAVDVVLLDLVLPDVDGLALLAAIRATRPQLPVIALTPRDDESSKLDGLNYGADDCVTKPFSLAELAARIRLRLRERDQTSSLIEAGRLVLDLASHRASIGDSSALLSARESTLLAAFMRHAGQVLSRTELLRLVWETDFDSGSNVVDVYVRVLRRKLGAQVIETVRGRGYRLRVS
jgi:DNA-binding response OmpR family regulator